MHRTIAAFAVLALGLAAGLVLTSRSSAGPEKIAFPVSWKSGVLYTTVNRHDIKQYRELYASSAEAVLAMKQGQALPYGTVLTLIQYKAQVDTQGNPVKDATGRFVKGDLVAYTVMEKRQGWGAEYAADLRNGEWEYALFGPDMKLNDKVNHTACFQCHKPHEKQDFVISLASLKGGAGGAGSRADVKIAEFAFGPAKLTAAPGQAVTWINDDDSPHQVVITTGGAVRGAVLTKGQSFSHTFPAAGTYDYSCGLHPVMKGQVEVK